MDSPVQFSRLHIDQIERLTAGQQQEIRLKTDRRTGRAIRTQINLQELCLAAIMISRRNSDNTPTTFSSFMLTVTNWLFSSLIISPTWTFIHFSLLSLAETQRKETNVRSSSPRPAHVSADGRTDSLSIDEDVHPAVIHLVVTFVSSLQTTKTPASHLRSPRGDSLQKQV